MADQKPQIFELNNGTMQVKITNLGCTITSLSLPDKNGNLADVVLGFDSVEPYLNRVAPYFGAIVGRVANRIKDGKFTLNGVDYTLPVNRPPNSLHGLSIINRTCSPEASFAIFYYHLSAQFLARLGHLFSSLFPGIS